MKSSRTLIFVLTLWALNISSGYSSASKANLHLTGYRLNQKESSKTERDRLSSEILKGHSIEAWRYAVQYLFNNDDEMRSNAMIVLLRLVGKQASYAAPAMAIIEQGLVRSRNLDYREATSLIWMYDMFAEPAGHFMDISAYKECSKLASSSHQDGRLSEKAIAKCNELLATADKTKWRASITILLSASHLRKADRQWSSNICRNLLRSVTGDESTMWAVLYETVIGKSLPKLR